MRNEVGLSEMAGILGIAASTLADAARDGLVPSRRIQKCDGLTRLVFAPVYVIPVWELHMKRLSGVGLRNLIRPCECTPLCECSLRPRIGRVDGDSK